MTTLSHKVREEFRDLVRDELKMVSDRAQELAVKHWEDAENTVAKELGYEDTVNRIEYLRNEISGIQAELADLEGKMVEKATPATRVNYENCGLKVNIDSYGRPYSKPMVFNHTISSVWDTLVLKKLNDEIAFFPVYKDLMQLEHAIRREIILAGTFEEARSIYYQFHQKVANALGDQMPKLLNESKPIDQLNKGNL